MSSVLSSKLDLNANIFSLEYMSNYNEEHCFLLSTGQIPASTCISILYSDRIWGWPTTMENAAAFGCDLKGQERTIHIALLKRQAVLLAESSRPDSCSQHVNDTQYNYLNGLDRACLCGTCGFKRHDHRSPGKTWIIYKFFGNGKGRWTKIHCTEN